LLRQLARSIRGTLEYGYLSNHDLFYDGRNNYNDHLDYSNLQ